MGVVVLGCLIAVVPAVDPSTADQEKTVTATRIEGGIVIDGVLDEAQWVLARPVSDFTQRDPWTGDPPSERTEVRLLYDHQNLYVGVLCFDSEGENGIVVNDMQRDFSPFESDTFLVVLDTFNDDRNAFLFNTNARGAKFDEQIGNDGAKINRDWDGIWHAKSRITPLGWQTEIAIPFKTLRFQNDEHQVWGVNFQRRIRRKNESVQWSLIPRPYSVNRISGGGTLEGLSGIRPGRNLYIKPYISTPVLRRQEDDVDFVPEAGVDVKSALGPQLTLDLTLNTDFSQVEADNQQINLTRFNLFFPEKREFFLENATLFQFGPGSASGRQLIPFFSRRIGISGGKQVPILGGARLTGRLGAYTLGLLSIQADEFKEIPSTNFTVARVRRDMFRKSEIGAIAIVKQEMGGSVNRTYGTDANFTFLNFLDISSLLLKTDTRGVQDEDMAGYFSAGWRDPLLTLQGGYLSIQDNFNPEVGFVPRKGIRETTGLFAVRPRPREKMPSILEFEPSIQFQYITDQDNLLETRIVEGRFMVRFRNGANVWVAGKSNFERLTEPFEIRSDETIPIGDYPFNEYTLSLASDRSRRFSGDLRVTTGDFYDGKRDSYSVSARFQRPEFRSEVSWTREKVNLTSGDFATGLLTARLNYSFSTNMFLNALIQYNSDRKEISSNIRLNLIYKPLSELFVVYNERRESTGEVAERALIAKLTYVFNF